METKAQLIERLVRDRQLGISKCEDHLVALFAARNEIIAWEMEDSGDKEEFLRVEMFGEFAGDYGDRITYGLFSTLGWSLKDFASLYIDNWLERNGEQIMQWIKIYDEGMLERKRTAPADHHDRDDN
jgi:hypothetical protein